MSSITVQKIEISILDLPMIRSFETSFGKLDSKQTVITKITTSDGAVGYGESSAFFAPIYNAETPDTCFYMLERFLAPLVIGKTFSSAEEFRDSYQHLLGHNMAKAGIECAFWHALAVTENKSLKELFGGTKSEIPVGESIGIYPTIKATLNEIEERLAEGYMRIKVKVKPGWDLAVIEAVRNLWPEIDLMVDGNSAYRLHKDLETMRAFGQFNLTMVEQPLEVDDIIDHGTLQRITTTPICMDESINKTDDARKAVQGYAAKIINIKPGRVGGIVESINIHDYAQANNIGVWCGGLLETGIGRAFNIALASKENFVYPADMSPPLTFYKEDLVETPFVIKPNGHIDVPTTPGLGFTVREDRIKKFTSKKTVITK